MNSMKMVGLLAVLGGTMFGLMCSDESVPAAGADGASVSASRYVEVVDEKGLRGLNQPLLRELACKKIFRGSTSTLLHIAALYATNFGVNAVRCVCYWGADVNAQNDKRDTPLHCAASSGNEEMMAYLRAQGADVTLVNNKGETAYEVFCKRQGREYTDVEFSPEPLFSWAMVNAAAQRFLFDAMSSGQHHLSKTDIALAALCGVDFSSITYRGETILHSEVGRDVLCRGETILHSEMVRDAESELMRFALSRVKEHPPCDALRMLVACGVPLFAKNREGKMAEQVAREKGFVAAADFLAGEMAKAQSSE